jgi:cell fate regulator YaaT (PSP1 superfamily)
MPELYLVEFKGNRRGYFFNTYYHTLTLGENVIVEAERGEDMGLLSKRVEHEDQVPPDEKPPSILRPAAEEDNARKELNDRDETEAIAKCRELVKRHGLTMKLIDSEYQHDRNKLTFYFTADQRVDFRSLVRDLAGLYKTRIELRQIGVRDAAKRLGGFGVCGLKQCCASFLKGFEPISTQFAREQNLALNPAKISGNCGRLLCCLTYEMEHYREALADFPKQGESYSTDKGEGVIDSINIFDDYMVVKHPNDETEKVTLTDIKKRDRQKKSFFQNWRSRTE